MDELKDIIDKGHAAYDTGRYEEALEHYARALELSPEDVDTWINLGLCHRHLENFEKAIEAYQRAIDFEPQSFLAWNNMGWAYHCKNDEERAREAYKKAGESSEGI